MDKKNKLLCDSCGRYFDSLIKNKNGYNYCAGCDHMQVSALKYNEPIKKADFDKMLKMALDTPPLELNSVKNNQKKKQGKKKKGSSS